VVVVVVGSSIKVEVGMGGFTVHCMAQRTVGSPVNIYVKEWEVTLSFGLHGELSALVVTVQVVQEVLQLFVYMWPDDEGVVHVAKSAEGFVGSQVKRPLLEVLHIEVGDDSRQWKAHGHTIDLFVELAIESEV
jgi:hypothetical protein